MDIDFTFIVRLLMYSLAVYRFTMLLYNEDGPFHMFDWLRHKAGIEVHSYSTSDDQDNYIEVVERTGEGFFAELLNCPYCLSGWVALFMSIGFTTNNYYFEWFAFYGAMWCIVYMLLHAVSHE